MRHRPALAMLLLTALLLAAPAHAVQPDEILDDPGLEARARAISENLRCLVCQNQSIDDSDAPLARDLRILVRERLEAGETDDEVVDFVVARYGEFVLLNPRLGAHTAVLWAAPILLLGAGAAIVVIALRRRRSTAAAEPLNRDEERALARLLDERD